MHRLLGLSVTPLILAALGACADPAAPPALDAGGSTDAAPVDLPLRPVTITVKSRARPAPGIRVFTSTSDGRFIADGVTDAAGKVTLMGGATATAFDSDAHTTPIGPDDTAQLGLVWPEPPVPSTTWAIEIATPPPFDGPLELLTPCGAFDRRIVVPSVASTSVEGPACDDTDVVGLLSSPAGRRPQLAIAPLTAGAPARFETWREIRPIQINVNVTSDPPLQPITTTAWALVAPGFTPSFGRSLAVGLPGIVAVDVPGRGRHARRFETIPTTMTVEASDFLPRLRTPELVGDAAHLRGLRLTDAGRAFDNCVLRFTADTPDPVYWTIETGPLADAGRVVYFPSVPNGLAISLRSELKVSCVQNAGFVDPTRPELTAIGSVVP